MTCAVNWAAIRPAHRSGRRRARGAWLCPVVLGALLLAWAAPAAIAAGPGDHPIGAYFTLVNTYIYTEGPREGRRHLVRPRNAYNVVDVRVDNEDTLWFRIVYPAVTTKLNGTGWTPSAPHELVSAQEEPVQVFSRIPTGDSGRYTVHRIPATSVELLNEAETVPAFPQVDWQRVRYRSEAPLRAWARGPAGIYRPGKTAAFMSRVYGELVTRDVEKAVQRRLLSGVIRVGDTVREVRWALGEPLRNQEETIGEARRSTWQYPELTVTFENDVVQQIN